MINNKKLSALFLTGAMIFSIGTTVFAQTKNVPTVSTGTEAKEASATITKNLEFAEGLSVPTASFEFVAEGKTAGSAQATIAPITYSNDADGANKGQVTDGKHTITKTSNIVFGEFPHAGLYEYTVKEKPGAVQGVTYSQDEYTLRVYVANRAGKGLYIKTITANKGQGDSNKQDNISFTNTYAKTSTLTISKQTKGDLADKTKQFDFTINFVKPANAQGDVTYTGMIGDTQVAVKAGEEKTFKLSDGQKLVFNSLPAGTRYVVKEVGVKDGYTPKVDVVENGVANPQKQGTDETDLTSTKDGNTNNLVGEGDNSVTYINEYADIAITGVILNNLPFILLIGVAVSGFVALAVIKRRRTSNK